MKEGVEHESEEGEPMKSCHGLRKSLVVSGQSAEARSPSERAFDYPSPWQEHESAFGLFEFYHNKSDSIGCCGLRRFLSRIAMVDKVHLDMFSGSLLNICRKISHLGSLLFIGRSDFQGELISQCVNCSMNFGPLLALVAIVTGAMSALRARLNGASIENHGRGAAVFLGHQSQDFAQVMRHGLEAASLDPSLSLLLNRIPRSQIVRNHAPRTPCSRHVTQGVEDGTHRVHTLWGFLLHEREIGGAERPLFIGNIAWLTDPTTALLALLWFHPKRNARM